MAKKLTIDAASDVMFGEISPVARLDYHPSLDGELVALIFHFRDGRMTEPICIRADDFDLFIGGFQRAVESARKTKRELVGQ